MTKFQIITLRATIWQEAAAILRKQYPSSQMVAIHDRPAHLSHLAAETEGELVVKLIAEHARSGPSVRRLANLNGTNVWLAMIPISEKRTIHVR